MQKILVAPLLIFLIFFASLSASGKSPDCAYQDGWASNMAFTWLKNAALVSNEDLDLKKTEVIEIASEKISKDLYRQIHRIRFYKRNGDALDVITVNNASHDECSMSGVDVYLISRKLGDYTYGH
ncbi:MAG: hypothetical protein M0Q15_13195 [Nevskia sp.]|nr:hypothetical protein [Nevskia sp.]